MTAAEVERLTEAAKANRHGPGDAAMVLGRAVALAAHYERIPTIALSHSSQIEAIEPNRPTCLLDGATRRTV